MVANVTSLDKTFMSQPRGNRLKKEIYQCLQQTTKGQRVSHSWVPVSYFSLALHEVFLQRKSSFVFRRDCFPATLETDF